MRWLPVILSEILVVITMMEVATRKALGLMTALELVLGLVAFVTILMMYSALEEK
jgi:hypothetical protein